MTLPWLERTATCAGARQVPRGEESIIVFAPTDRRHFLAALFPAILPARQVDDFDADAVLHPSYPICGFPPVRRKNGAPKGRYASQKPRSLTEMRTSSSDPKRPSHRAPVRSGSLHSGFCRTSYLTGKMARWESGACPVTEVLLPMGCREWLLLAQSGHCHAGLRMPVLCREPQIFLAPIRNFEGTAQRTQWIAALQPRERHPLEAFPVAKYAFPRH